MEGDRLRVRPGDAVPVDGTVIEGRSSLAESMLTGESMPVEKGPGDALTGATFNKNGSPVIAAGKVGSDTVLAKLVAMVSNRSEELTSEIQSAMRRSYDVICVEN